MLARQFVNAREIEQRARRLDDIEFHAVVGIGVNDQPLDVVDILTLLVLRHVTHVPRVARLVVELEQAHE